MDVLHGNRRSGGADAFSRAGKGLVDATDEADRGDLVDGVAAFARLRGRVRDAGPLNE